MNFSNSNFMFYMVILITAIDEDNISIEKQKDGFREIFKIRLNRLSYPVLKRKTLTVKLMEPISI